MSSKDFLFINEIKNKAITELNKISSDTIINFNNIDWKCSSNNVKIIYNKVITSFENVNNFAYIWYNGVSDKNKKMTFLKNKNYEVVLKGNTCEDLNVDLFIITYKNNKKDKIFSSKINKPLRLNFNENINYNIAIRVQGIGEAVFSQILIENIEKNQKNKPGFIVKYKKHIKDIKMACIFDKFTTECYKYNCNLIPFTPENWYEVFESQKPDILVVESAWEGNDGAWHRMVAKYKEDRRDPLYKVIKYCRKNNIPTIFWNKEDPVHFDAFIDTASWFDYIFTTDENCIEKYKEATGNQNVYAMPFAAQPKIHNPIEYLDKRENKFCFAGSYYAEKYEERKKDLDRLLDITKKYGLVIYDRNYGLNLAQFEFPKKFKKYIKGRLEAHEIFKAYKGYRYAININSVKDSPTMFSRRVFELLASNTPVISSYSKGIEKIFGDVVICSDNKDELLKRIDILYNDNLYYDFIKLKGLRITLSKHTYMHRLKTFLNIIGVPLEDSEIGVSVLAYVDNLEQFHKVYNMFQNQSLSNKELIVISYKLKYKDIIDFDNCRLLESRDINNIINLAKYNFISIFDENNYYGKNYLIDLTLATSYSDADIIGKFSYYEYSNKKINLVNKGFEYKYVTNLNIASTIFNKKLLLYNEELLNIILNKNYKFDFNGYFEKGYRLFSTDRFNFIKNIKNEKLDNDILAKIDDEVYFKTCKYFNNKHDNNDEIEKNTNQNNISDNELLISRNWIQNSDSNLQLENKDNGLFIKSHLDDKKYEYIRLNINNLQPTKQNSLRKLEKRFFLFDFKGKEYDNVNTDLFIIGYNSNNEKVKIDSTKINSKKMFLIDSNISRVELLIRLSGPGSVLVDKLDFTVMDDKFSMFKSFIPRKTDERYLILTNIYPSKNDLYRNGFVHRRVKLYKEKGLSVDVFCLNQKYKQLSNYRYDGVDVYLGDNKSFGEFLDLTDYKKVLIHFVNKDMISVLDKHAKDTPLIVWIHGFETEKWHRRLFNLEKNLKTLLSLKSIIKESNEKMKFMHDLYTNKDKERKIDFIFVSKWFKEEVAEKDTNCKVINSHIIPNVVDDNLFKYEKKDKEQRKKILSIRPYTSRKYANDLTVKAILELSKEPFFDELEFNLYGDGKLFDETLEPIRKFKNVNIYRKFLTQEEIANLHKKHGIFMCPTRLDAQGVSMCEAMSSGLVPITNGITAIPEFVDKDSGILGRKNNYKDLAKGIKELYYNPDKFLKMSENASKKIREKCSIDVVISRELELILKK